SAGNLSHPGRRAGIRRGSVTAARGPAESRGRKSRAALSGEVKRRRSPPRSQLFESEVPKPLGRALPHDAALFPKAVVGMLLQELHGGLAEQDPRSVGRAGLG